MKSFSDWIEEARFYLLNKDGTSNAVFMQRVSIIDTYRPLPGLAPAAIGVRANRELTILFCYPLVQQLEPPAAAELLKHELLHYVFGHLSERIRELRGVFGDTTVLVAMDLVINQFCDEKLLADAGFPGVTVEKFGFPTNLTTEQYCKLLQVADPSGKTAMDKLSGEFSNAFQDAARPGGQDIDELSKASGEAKGSSHACAGEVETSGRGVLVEVFANSKELDAELRDEAVVKAVEESRAEADKVGLKCSRGWDSGEAMEFIARIKRPAVVRWQGLIHKMASCHMNVRRVSSRRRPSRRHPAYFGRVKRMGSDMWLGVDTSGSMGKEELQLVDPEARMLSQQDVHIMVVHVDAEVAKIEPYDPHQGLVNFAGRGGTDFSPLFFALDKLPRAERPAFLVYFTDGFGGCEQYLESKRVTYSGKRPKVCPSGVETLWLIPEGCLPRADFMNLVPFGEVLIVPRPEKETR